MKLQLASALAVGMALAAPAARASDVERTVRAELSGADLSSFRVENLVGTMRITVGAADRVTVVATVHAEEARLGEAVRIERVASSGGPATLRVRYPYEKVKTFQYRSPGDGSNWSFPDAASSSSYEYDGQDVRVSPRRGTRLYADLDVQVPASAVRAEFRALVGLVDADGLKGTLHFSVESADLRLRRLDGEIELASSSGDVRASEIRGTWKSEFSSGDCRIDGFEGDLLRFQASSGDLAVRGLKAGRVSTETSSGDVTLSSADLEEFDAEATSGDVTLALAGSRLKSIRVDTSSGDVKLRLPPAVAFEASADQSSGDMNVGFDDGTAVWQDDTVVGYRHGTGGARIRVTTSSGDLTIMPI